jgi:hypothetical protein
MEKNFSEVIWREDQEDLLRDDEWTEYVSLSPIEGTVNDKLWLWDPADVNALTSNALKQNTIIRLDDETCTVEVYIMDPMQMDSPTSVADVI